MFSLKNMVYRFERLMTAATYAQAGMHETAREILREPAAADRPRNARKVRKHIDRRPVLRA